MMGTLKGGVTRSIAIRCMAGIQRVALPHPKERGKANPRIDWQN